MTIHPGKEKCCRRIIEVTIFADPNQPPEVGKQREGNERNIITEDTVDKVKNDSRNNPDQWRVTGPDPDGNYTATRPAKFCGDELKEFYNDPPGNPNNLSGSPDWDYA